MNHLENTRFIFNKYAGSYKEKYLDQADYAHVLTEFLGAIPEGGKVLDLGCGPGNISRFLLDTRSDLQVTGVDIAPEMLKEARALNPEAKFYEGNVLEVGDLVQGGFDGVVSGFVLPYLNEKEVGIHLGQMRDLLDPVGVIYLSFLEGKPEDFGFKGSSDPENKEVLYMNFHPEERIAALADQAGFTLEKRAKKTPRSQNGEPTNNEIMMILKWS